MSKRTLGTSTRFRLCTLAVAASICPFASTEAKTAVAQRQLKVQSGTHFVRPDRFKDASKSLGEVIAESAGGRGAALEHAVKLRPRLRAGRGGPEAALQTKSIGPLDLVSLAHFEGIGPGLGYVPPYAAADTSGAVGSTQYVEWVNEALAVFDKRNPGTNRRGPIDGSALWKGIGGPCEEFNDGDPVVEFDSLAQRWLLSQFAIQSGPPFYQCIAVSASDDALGLYHLYAYRFDTYLNDYPKFGVWSDGYYAAFNLFDDETPKGARVCAFNRTKMLAGDKDAEMECFDLSEDFGLLPSDLVGREPPPGGAPNYFLSLGDKALNLYSFHVDWSDARKSTLTGPKPLPVPTYTMACDGRRACIPQPGSAAQLSALGERLMYRLAYRRLGVREVLTVNHSVQVKIPRRGAEDRTGIRWYEIFDPQSEKPQVEAATYSPDKLHRWMGSAATDRMGNLVLGYTASGNGQKPSPRLAGRRSDDKEKALRDEVTLQESTGTTSEMRWGDYSTMSVDPEDDCTFWYVTQYLTARDTDKWHSEVFSFRFPNCTAEPSPQATAATGAGGPRR